MNKKFRTVLSLVLCSVIAATMLVGGGNGGSGVKEAR